MPSLCIHRYGLPWASRFIVWILVAALYRFGEFEIIPHCSPTVSIMIPSCV